MKKLYIVIIVSLIIITFLCFIIYKIIGQMCKPCLSLSSQQHTMTATGRCLAECDKYCDVCYSNCDKNDEDCIRRCYQYKAQCYMECLSLQTEGFTQKVCSECDGAGNDTCN